MAASDEWIENARVVWEAMGSPNVHDKRRPSTPWMPEVDQPPPPEMSDHDIGEWARRELSLFNWNVASTVSYGHKIMSSDDPKLALAFLNLSNMYDHSDGGGAEFSRALLGLATDPTTYVGMGVGSVAARGVAKATAKSGLTKMMKMGVVGATAGAVEGGSLAGGFDLVVQNIEQEAGARQDIDYGRALTATGIGMGAGIILGGGGGTLAGRKMDKLAAIHDELQRVLDGVADVEAERAAAGLTADQLGEMVGALIKAENLTANQRQAATIVSDYMAKGNKVPRHADGTIDEVAFAEKLIEYADAEDAKAALAAEMLEEQEQAYRGTATDEELGLADIDEVTIARRKKAAREEGVGPEGGRSPEEVVAEGRPKDMTDEEWDIIQRLAGPWAGRMTDLGIRGYDMAVHQPDHMMFQADIMTPEQIANVKEAAKKAGLEVTEGGPETFMYNENYPWEVEKSLRVDGDEEGLIRFVDELIGPPIDYDSMDITRIVNEINARQDPNDPSGWFFDEKQIPGDDAIPEGPGELSYYEPDSDYADLKALAKEMGGIEYEIAGRGGVKAFFIKGDNTNRLEFIAEVARRQTRETILPGRRGGKPFTVEEGLARGLDDEQIAALEMNPINVVEKLERAGFKVVMGEEGDILFDATTMSDATTERINRVAEQTDVEIGISAALDGKNYTVSDRGKATPSVIRPTAGEETPLGFIEILDPDDALLKQLEANENLQVHDPWEGGPRGEGTPSETSKADYPEAIRIYGTEEELGKFGHESPSGEFYTVTTGQTGYISISGDPVNVARFGSAMAEEVAPARLPVAESRAFARRIAEMEKTATQEVIAKTASLPGSYVRDITGSEFEVMGRTKNGWYHLRNRLTGEEINRRRNQFEVLESYPKPEMAGPMELKPFTKSAAKIIAMNEDIVSGKLEKVKITTAEQKTIVEELRRMGIKIDEKSLSSHWSPAELLFLRDTYNAQANGIADLARLLANDLENNGRLTDQQMAMFNEAHTQFVATRDLFFGVSGNAARQLQILKTRPTDEVYEFSQAIMDSLSISGGRANTERAITAMAQVSDAAKRKPGQTRTGAITTQSQSIWGNKVASAFLIVRYNMMLSSWRTHFFNFLGNSASGVYQHGFITPIRAIINNMAYARDVALSVVDPKYAPDPADRMTRHQVWAPIRSHFSSARDSLMLAKEIALGRDIGEGKVWNELGLRYNVINVPESAFGKLGTTPVRLLEAGDAFFKNQYYMAKVHELASVKARYDEIHRGLDFETKYREYVDTPDAPTQRQAKEFAAKQTYTNDPNVYGGVLAALARGAAAAQNRSIIVNMIVPFVRTPANLLSYSMEMIGVNQVLSLPQTYRQIMKGSAAESQEAMARLTVAAGLWLVVAEMYQNGDITGVGPASWEERKAWEAAGWQPNSIRIYDKWYDISRADPAATSLISIASVFDFYNLTRQDRRPKGEWVGAGLLYTADMLVDESYLSTASDVITAISSKEEARVRSVGASLVNSVMIPNLIRDIRRATDPVKRSGASDNFVGQMVNQMKNAFPWWSEDLAPQRDWKGEPLQYYGSAYTRGLIPFDIRNPQDSDEASMAVAYARIPPSTPSRSIAWPKGQGDSIELFAMDNGDGYVYDKYVQMVGKARHKAVKELLRKPIWRQMVEEGNIGPGSDGDRALREVMAIGSHVGRLQMLDFLIKHSGDNNTFQRDNGDTIIIHHPVSVGEYRRLRREVRLQNIPVPEGLEQYDIQERQEGPEFFTPRTPE
jgi:hypothetical protein